MGAYVIRKVIVQVEFTIRGAESEGAAVDEAVNPIKAIPGAEIKSATVQCAS
jgi:amino acid permease